MAEHRFLRTRDGVTRFAKVTVVSTESQAWSTSVSEAVRELGAVYAQAIQDGVHLAVAEQSRRAGQNYSIVDAVECAVGVATWKSFGGDEIDVSIRFDGGRWKAAFE